MNKNSIFILTVFSVCCVFLSGCAKSKEKVTIYSSAEEYRNAYIKQALVEKFPEYDIDLQYMPSGNQMAKLLAEGSSTACDISYDIDYGYAEKAWDCFATLSYDTSKYLPDTLFKDGSRIEPDYRNGGCIVLNNKILKEKNLTAPTSYEDLLKPEFKGLISMPNPKSSGTGYIFLKSLVNAWGEDAAFTYFDKLSENILQFTSSGSGPVNELVQGEAAVGLGMIAQAVVEINKGADLSIVFFKEGAPYCVYGMGVIKGKETRKAVMDVYQYIESTVSPKDKEQFVPEKIYTNIDFNVKNFPASIPYADMNNNTQDEKERLLAKWQH
jgi:iron(III) transport system substrate-binding protein